MTTYIPLAERLRPTAIEQIIGQEHLLGENRGVRSMIMSGEIPSLIFWGPPGSGKTTLARIIADNENKHFIHLSAVQVGVKEIRQVVQDAKQKLQFHQKRTYLFLDEIHRFNKAQQDTLLPHVETGLITLIGATTENPSFEINAALLSRCRVLVLKPLSRKDILDLLKRAIDTLIDEETTIAAEPEALEQIADYAEGDARRALTTLEIAIEVSQLKSQPISQAIVHDVIGKRLPRYDKTGEEHYNIISAFIKSMRGSNPDAAVYWMARMLEGGEDPKFITRRMVIFASEDIGLADPTALAIAVHASKALEIVGLPEATLPLTQAVIHLSCAPKSNTVLKSYMSAKQAVSTYGSLAVPNHLRNAPTSLMRSLEYGKDYKYPHDYPEHFVNEQYLPDQIKTFQFVELGQQGREKQIADLRKKRRQ